ncbi:MAG: GNAT family N-acetyltransferase [Solirubrobacteraceae bacterium]|nr:GNAT family N-acetyltransferase [Solirubrobacteraceae bacterium]
MPVRVWRAEHHEAEAVSALLVAFRNHVGADWPSDNAFFAGVDKLIEDPNTEFLLASIDDDSPPTGVLQLRFRFGIWKAATDAWLEDLYVLPEARRHGLGDALVALAIERAAERGCRRIELDAYENNTAAVALYERHGFSNRSKSADGRDLLFGRVIEPPEG